MRRIAELARGQSLHGGHAGRFKWAEGTFAFQTWVTLLDVSSMEGGIHIGHHWPSFRGHAWCHSNHMSSQKVSSEYGHALGVRLFRPFQNE